MSDDTIPNSAKACEVANKRKLANVERHIFLCTDCEREKCCNSEQMMKTWKVLVEEMKTAGLSVPVGPLNRSKAQCLGMCASHAGPIAVVYPEGIWYHSVDEEAARKIIHQHLVAGAPVEELVFCKQDNI